MASNAQYGAAPSFPQRREIELAIDESTTPLNFPNLCSTLIVLEVLSNLSNIYAMRVAVAMFGVGFEFFL